MKPRSTKKATNSHRCGCHFAAKLNRVADGWRFTVVEGSHSGHVASIAATHPIHRRRKLEEVREQVLGYFDLSHTAMEIINMVRKEDKAKANPPESTTSADNATVPNIATCLTRKDISNLRQAVRRQNLGGCTATESLLKGIQGWDIPWKEVTDDTHRVEHVFCASKDGFSLLARYPTLVWIDATYKTNRYNMPLVDIVGKTATGNTFYICDSICIG